MTKEETPDKSIYPVLNKKKSKVKTRVSQKQNHRLREQIYGC